MYKVKKGKENIAINGCILATASQDQLKEFFLMGCPQVEKEAEEAKPKAKRKKKTEDSEN